uniref:Uncharacterized protein n=1 Tax=Cacopsylla melanoneura TaxID=428564 RepID=A0A8D8QS78_9HEMI
MLCSVDKSSHLQLRLRYWQPHLQAVCKQYTQTQRCVSKEYSTRSLAIFLANIPISRAESLFHKVVQTVEFRVIMEQHLKANYILEKNNIQIEILKEFRQVADGP